MKKLLSLIALVGLAVSLSAGVTYTDSAMDETYPRPLVVDQI
ncbi:hypothetical protein [Halobacillus faecis]|uniref:Uncharacterized protein n=1 Tax=Halobacillus faecis TaxID=360184 RepID=A0A511WQH1_9BACI|nr:hypothetical protein [Halobacillus faecis]GEN53386.1 hypothetical protein HFA01_16480 [Halobacillus faecis]